MKVSQIISTTTLESVWEFITSQTVKEITIWRYDIITTDLYIVKNIILRYIFASSFVFMLYPILTYVLGPVGEVVLGRAFQDYDLVRSTGELLTNT